MSFRFQVSGFKFQEFKSSRSSRFKMVKVNVKVKEVSGFKVGRMESFAGDLGIFAG